jgi:hypothetical protein
MEKLVALIDIDFARAALALVISISIAMIGVAAVFVFDIKHTTVKKYISSDDEGVNASDQNFSNLSANIVIFSLHLLIVTFSIAVALAYYFKDGAFGQIGDLVGGLLNPMVSLLAFILIATSIKIQKEELAATRKELASSAISHAEQVKITQEINKESRFFRLIEDLDKSISGISFNVDNPPSDLPPAQAFEMRVRGAKPTETGRTAIRRIIAIHNNNFFANRPQATRDLDKVFPALARQYYDRISQDMEGQTTKIYLIFSIIASIIDLETEKRGMYISITRCIVGKYEGLIIFREADLAMASSKSVAERSIARKTFDMLSTTEISNLTLVDLTIPGYIYPGAANLSYTPPFPRLEP